AIRCRRAGRNTRVSSPFIFASGEQSMPSSTPRDAVRLSPNATTVLEKRYLLKDDHGKPVETPRDLFQRVATTIAEPDRQYGATAAEVEATATAFYGM